MLRGEDKFYINYFYSLWFANSAYSLPYQKFSVCSNWKANFVPVMSNMTLPHPKFERNVLYLRIELTILFFIFKNKKNLPRQQHCGSHSLQLVVMSVSRVPPPRHLLVLLFHEHTYVQPLKQMWMTCISVREYLYVCNFATMTQNWTSNFLWNVTGLENFELRLAPKP